jgi:hypothetical protein
MENKAEPTQQNPSTKPSSTTSPNPIATAVAPIDKVCFESDDGQIIISQLVKTAHKFPPHNYPCVVLAAKPADHTRVRRVGGGYIEIMPSFLEMEELVDAMNNVALASGKGKLYDILQRVPEKPRERKERWKQRNEMRVKQGKKLWHKY